MHGRKILKQVQKVEHVGCISRQLSTLLAFMTTKTFVSTAKISCCDRRTVPCGIAGLHVLQNHFMGCDRPSQRNYGQDVHPRQTGKF